MPLSTEYLGMPTYSWMQRTAQITEFNLLKDTVKRLERSSREQLLLENESQGAFDHLTAEVGRLKDAISALSKVVDDEVEGVRGECRSLRQELQNVYKRSREEARSAVEAVGEKRKQDTAASVAQLQQVRNAVNRLDEELHQSRSQYQTLTNDIVRLDGGIDAARSAAAQQCEALGARMSAAETQSAAIRGEINDSLRRQQELYEAELQQQRAEYASGQTEVKAESKANQVAIERLEVQQRANAQATEQAVQDLQVGHSATAQQVEHLAGEDAQLMAAIERHAQQLQQQEMQQQEMQQGLEQQAQQAQQAQQMQQANEAVHTTLNGAVTAVSDDVLERCAGLRVVFESSLADVAEAARANAAEAERRQEETSKAIAAAEAEQQRHRDAIQLLVESAAAAREAAQNEDSALAERVDHLSERTEERDEAIGEQLRALASEVDAGHVTLGDVRDAVRQLDGRLRSQEGQGGSLASSLAATATRHTERCRAIEAEVNTLKQESAAANAQARAFKAADKTLADQLNAQKQSTRRALDEHERRHEAYDDAVATFAEALKIPNPVVSSAASAL